MKTKRNRRTSLWWRRLLTGMPLALVVMLAASPVSASQNSAAASATQAEVDSHWLPWLGCWNLLEQSSTVRTGMEARLADEFPSLFPEKTPRVVQGVRVCVAPGKTDPAVKMSTIVNEQTVLEQTMVADSTPRPITESGCQGWQRAEWSRRGQRLFTQAELACGDQPMRTVSGLSLMTAGPTWLDVQVVRIGEEETVQVRRYRHAGDQTGAGLGPDVLGRALSAARRLGGTPLTIEDIQEASAKVSAKVLEAALAEAKPRFDLNGRALIDLADAGVSASVIDVMVALSFPEHFAVERSAPGSFSSSSSWSSWSTSSGIFGVPTWFGSSMYSGYYPYGSYPYQYGSYPYGSYPHGSYPHGYYPYGYYPYGYYSPFNYSYWGYYRPSYSLTPLVPSMRGRTQSAVPSSGGQAVTGRGYTRSRPRDGSGQATPRGDGSHEGSLGGSGGVSPRGYSGGGSRGSSGSGSSGGSSGGTAGAK